MKQVKKINSRTHFSAYYHAEYAQTRYRTKRQKCRPPTKFSQVAAFLAFFVEAFKGRGFSSDAVVGFAKRHNLFSPDKMVSTTTLYAYIDAQRLEIRNIDLLMKLSRRSDQPILKRNRKVFGQSIEERPASVDIRTEFVHFEIETIIGKRNGAETALLTLTERMTRFEIIRAIDGKDADSVTYTLRQLMDEYSSNFSEIFRSITSDNRSEFSQLKECLKGFIAVYFTHTYSSCEHGTNENHTRVIRLYLPKGESIDGYARSFLEGIADKMNQLPRKILGYVTPNSWSNQPGN